MSAVLETANAKINLTLKVLGKRADGYHLLESLVVFADVADRLTCAEADHLSLELSGPFASALEGESDNLVLEAARRMAVEMDRTPNLAFTLEKSLPVASGIGGGSADAAAAMRTLVRLWGDPESSLADIALSLGADVPVCLRKKSSLMSGIGEALQPLQTMPEFDAILVNPGVAVSTKDVFRALGASQGWDMGAEAAAPSLQTKSDVLDYLMAHPNDLEAPAVRVQPAIANVLNAIRETENCQFVRMSGSGATCFGLYDNLFDAADAAAKLRTDHPDWWVVATRFMGSGR